MNNNLIYLHINKITNKKYVGRTCHTENPNKRWKNGEGYKKQPYFYNDIIKHGWDNFEHIILESGIPDNLIDKKENYWINFYESNNPEKGYNSRASGSVSSSTREKMSENWFNNPNRVKQAKSIITAYNKKADRTGKNNGMYGKKRNGKNAGNRKRVKCLETGYIFETLTDASNWCNPNGGQLRSKIALQIRGERKSCGKHPITKEPLHWEYVTNEE